jgi:hypothetical protein
MMDNCVHNAALCCIDGPTDESATGMQARLAKKACKETKISRDQNDWILVIKIRRHRMLRQQRSKVMKKRKVSTKTKRDAMTETVSKKVNMSGAKRSKRNGCRD